MSSTKLMDISNRSSQVTLLTLSSWSDSDKATTSLSRQNDFSWSIHQQQGPRNLLRAWMKRQGWQEQGPYHWVHVAASATWRPLRQRNATGWDLHKLHYHRTRSSCSSDGLGKTIRKSRLQSVSWSWRRGAHVRSIATPHCGRSTRDRWRTATVLILDVLDTGDSLLTAFRPFPENTASTSIQHPGWVWHNVRAVFWQLQNYDIPRIPVQLERAHTHTHTPKKRLQLQNQVFWLSFKN